jgi:hypothetical protein
VEESEVVGLLREMRDLQRAHLQNYKDALRNQEEAIALQRQVVRRQRIAFIVLIVIVLFGALLLGLPGLTRP